MDDDFLFQDATIESQKKERSKDKKDRERKRKNERICTFELCRDRATFFHVLRWKRLQTAQATAAAATIHSIPYHIQYQKKRSLK